MNCEGITGVLWLERSSYKEQKALLPKVLICYVFLKKAFELLYIVTSLFPGEYVGNCGEQRAAHIALCSSRKRYFRSGLKDYLETDDCALRKNIRGVGTWKDYRGW